LQAKPTGDPAGRKQSVSNAVSNPSFPICSATKRLPSAPARQPQRTDPCACSGDFPPQSTGRGGLLMLVGSAHSCVMGTKSRESIYGATIRASREGGAQGSRSFGLRRLEPTYVTLPRAGPTFSRVGRRTQRRLQLSRGPVPRLRYSPNGRA